MKYIYKPTRGHLFGVQTALRPGIIPGKVGTLKSGHEANVTPEFQMDNEIHSFLDIRFNNSYVSEHTSEFPP